MRNIMTLFVRELKIYFMSPLAYIIAFLFLFPSGNMFTSFLEAVHMADIGYVGQFLLLILLLCPSLAIKLFSEEKRSGTIELLLTSPVSPLEIVVAKFLAAFALYCIILSITLLYVFFMAVHSTVGPDYGIVFTAYLGLLLLGGSLISIGVFVSSLTQSQVIAVIGGLVVSLFFLLIDQFVSQSSGLVTEIIKELSLLSHYIDFHRGIINIQHIVYYLLWISLSLLLANKAVESYVWK